MSDEISGSVVESGLTGLPSGYTILKLEEVSSGKPVSLQNALASASIVGYPKASSSTIVCPFPSNPALYAAGSP
jgi:hypothetical protein